MATKRETQKTGNVEVSKDPDTGELYIELPQRMLDGTWQIKKITEKDDE